MNLSDIAHLRLANQQLAGSKFTSPKEIVAWMGAMQAQDYPMAKWGIGVRLPGSTDKDVENAISTAQIIRTHLLRPTWHFVTPEDIYWMIDLCKAQLKTSQSSRDRQLELTETIYTKSNAIIEKALSNGKQLLREELIALLNQAGIATDENRAAHLFARAEIEKIMCSGATRNGKTTYALLAERVPKARQLTRDEALAELARRYFTSRYPASLQDFTWWSGLPARDAKHALESIRSAFTTEIMNQRTYWLASNFNLPRENHPSAYLLPTYDEFIISYNDREASITTDLTQYLKKISDRGVFRPIIVLEGQVAGIWKRTIQKDTIQIEIQPFKPLKQSMKNLLVNSAEQYGYFCGKKIDVKGWE